MFFLTPLSVGFLRDLFSVPSSSLSTFFSLHVSLCSYWVLFSSGWLSNSRAFNSTSTVITPILSFYSKIFSSQSHISDFLSDISSWIAHHHLKLNMSKRQLSPVPLVDSTLFPWLPLSLVLPPTPHMQCLFSLLQISTQDTSWLSGTDLNVEVN